MSAESDRFFAAVQEIQKHCCCRYLDERECYKSRYPSPMDDYSDEWEYDDGFCECACHNEITVLEQDIWPDELESLA